MVMDVALLVPGSIPGSKIKKEINTSVLTEGVKRMANALHEAQPI
jgi:hypothetical protein